MTNQPDLYRVQTTAGEIVVVHYVKSRVFKETRPCLIIVQEGV
jgi:hypothetical protein